MAVTDGMGGLELYKATTSYCAGCIEIDESVLEHVKAVGHMTNFF